jgi:flagellar biosynthesis/type III secretory pathway protein FliH
MTEIQDQYTEFAKRGQEAASNVVDAWAKTVQEVTSQLPSVATPEGAQQVVDQLFDFGTTVIDVQRNLIKQFITASATVAENVSKNLNEHSPA